MGSSLMLLNAARAEPPILRRRCGAAGKAYRCATSPVGGVWKRGFDILAASIGLLALSPLLLTLSLLIPLDSPGPAFFRQRRAGFRGRLFYIWKFRTMRVAEDGACVVQARPGDPRVTRLGRFLRSTSIDELPQLVNVLLGEMSLVGPRPHAIVHEYAFRDLDRTYGLRRFARPGITGLAQVSGARGVTDTEDKIIRRLAYDLEYVATWSSQLDLRILFRTLRCIVNDPEAL